MTPESLSAAMRANGATRLLAKRLAPNDNSKNQIYLGGDYSAIQLIPFGQLREDSGVQAGSKRARMKAPVDFHWLSGDGGVERAEGANLILYPKYPEVRLSGILRGVSDPSPAEVIVPRDEGRWLFLGVTGDGRIIAHAAAAGSQCARWGEEAAVALSATDVFRELPLQEGARPDIMTALRRISDRGWITSKRLDGEGRLLPCNSSNCGGYTLEAELGIRPNGRAEPDYDGWEVKQFEVADLGNPHGGRLTLMTPEPDGGLYKDDGPETFVRRFGYRDRRGVADRLNFGGVHRAGSRHPLTNLELVLSGWDMNTNRMISVGGGIELRDATGFVAARWSFESLLNHWKRKHAKAVYVPSNCETEPRRYRYGAKVFVGVGTEFPLLLRAVSTGDAFYDPGIKLVNASDRPTVKRRSQFRIASGNLRSLYQDAKWVDLERR
jgi:hypothetical protein